MITELLRKGLSVRVFQDRPVPDGALHQMLEADRVRRSAWKRWPFTTNRE
jgi:hypothetical protein